MKYKTEGLKGHWETHWNGNWFSEPEGKSYNEGENKVAAGTRKHRTSNSPSSTNGDYWLSWFYELCGKLKKRLTFTNWKDLKIW